MVDRRGFLKTALGLVAAALAAPLASLLPRSPNGYAVRFPPSSYEWPEVTHFFLTDGVLPKGNVIARVVFRPAVVLRHGDDVHVSVEQRKGRFVGASAEVVRANGRRERLRAFLEA